MSVQVIDVKTGKLKTMGAKYANILVKMKRARWPEAVVEVQPEPAAEPVREVEPVQVETPAEVQDEPKKRGRKPKVQE